MTTPPLSAQEQQILQQKIEENTGGQLHVRLRMNAREEQGFYVAYVLPPGAIDRTPPDPEGLGALVWVAAETREEALLRLAASLGLDGLI